MGFGFNLFFIFILVPLTGILLIAWLLSRKLWIGKILGFIWLGIFGLALLSGIVQWLTSKTELDKDDYYGEYVINRDYFKGEQTDWQYNHFRFEITDEDSIFFYVTDKEKILKTYRGTIKTTTPYSSARLIIEMDQPTHHIMTSNPTTYRSAWDFYLVFKSPKIYNVFFEKGKWKPID
ncbi:hypothetical protein [Persicobacter psychrovividus]|uniref:Uncharacterized protein n=1 Tax=Persicobacter psychrovividus TaxID=387638 RepID=A0ABN6LIQ9_9BACT|nr:hypothetical protein PEPS_37370 [Persicobacter psychrovividus]